MTFLEAAEAVLRAEKRPLHYKEITKEEKKAGKKSGTNLIKIRHEDGTTAVYLHLKEEGVVVKVGDKVKAGQQIGNSGNTGKSSAPHLHVAVFRASAKGTLHIRFRTSNSDAEYLERGRRYRNPK